MISGKSRDIFAALAQEHASDALLCFAEAPSFSSFHFAAKKKLLLVVPEVEE